MQLSKFFQQDGSRLPQSRRSAFTLIEMLLTLSMCVVLMTLVGGAMNFYIRDMSTAEDSFRQSEVASAVLQMIEDDLRMTITTRPVSTDGLADLLSAAASPLSALGLDETSGASDDPEALPDDTGLADDDLSGDPLAAETLDSLTGGTVLVSPGLIGSATQLQIDVSRLPRLEESVIDPMMAVSGGQLLDRPSDVKTISYFVQEMGSGNQNDALEKLATANSIPASSVNANQFSGGLVRREIDRAIHVEASSTGGIGRLTGTGELIAAEVASISFEYFDTINWLTTYSTDDSGFLPSAVRITLELAGENDGDTRTFTHVVFLPMSHPEDADAEESLDEETDSGI